VKVVDTATLPLDRSAQLINFHRGMDLECDVPLSSTLASLSPDSASASVIASIPPEAVGAVRSSDVSQARSRRNRTKAKYRAGDLARNRFDSR
jgi:hypothetical protein